MADLPRRSKGEAMKTNFADIWEAVADGFGDRVAIVQGDVLTTWREFEQRSARLAGAFAEMGVTPGSKVAIDLYNCAENLETIFAAFKLRAVPFNINYRYREKELAYLLNDARPVVLVHDGSLADRVSAAVELADHGVEVIEVRGQGNSAPGTRDYEEVISTTKPATRVERDADDELIIYTGGTTGYPKGVIWGHSSLAMLPLRGDRRAETVEEFVDCLTENGPYSVLVLAPLMHATGILGAMGALAGGGTVLFCASRSLNPEEILTLVGRYRAKRFGVIGDAIAKPILELLDKARDEGRPYDLSSVESISNTGGIWSAEVKRGFFRHGSFSIIDGVNATEGAGFATSVASHPDEVGTAKFRLGPNARVVTEDGRDVLPGSGEIGRLAVTGRLPKGYLNDPDKTARTWPTIGGVRYSIPGDMATVEADGTVTLLGRNSEVVNTGGEKVFVEEVEAALASHPSVRDSLVVGLPDERWGNRVTAVVALRPGHSPTDRELMNHVASLIADYKKPREVIFVDEVPRNPTGKADRVSARDMAQRAHQAMAESASASASSPSDR